MLHGEQCWARSRAWCRKTQARTASGSGNPGVMVISAVCSGIGGMLGVAHFGSAQQNEFDTYLLDSIAAVVVGGTSLFGGQGGIGNTVIGLLVLGVLNNGLDHINIDSFLKILIRGLILLAALVINVYAQRMRSATEQQI